MDVMPVMRMRAVLVKEERMRHGIKEQPMVQNKCAVLTHAWQITSTPEDL